MTDGFALPHSILMLGCGNMGAAIVAGIAAQMPSVEVTAVDRDPARAQELLPVGPRIQVFADVDHLPSKRFDVCILCVKPQDIPRALEGAKSRMAGSLIISIAAGIPLSHISLQAEVTSRFVRVMPNLPAMVGCSMSVGYANPGTLSAADIKTVEAVFSAIGQFSWVDEESDIDLATGISGSGPGYVFAFVDCLQQAAEQMGFAPDVAQRLARQTIIGAGRLLERDERSARALKQAVASPGGTTQAALAVLDAPGGLAELLTVATGSAASRARELAQ
jgi:pyrroline-5-carboxylate reductase